MWWTSVFKDVLLLTLEYYDLWYGFTFILSEIVLIEKSKLFQVSLI